MPTVAHKPDEDDEEQADSAIHPTRPRLFCGQLDALCLACQVYIALIHLRIQIVEQFLRDGGRTAAGARGGGHGKEWNVLQDLKTAEKETANKTGAPKQVRQKTRIAHSEVLLASLQLKGARFQWNDSIHRAALKVFT
jgi:hypothetical protein